MEGVAVGVAAGWEPGCFGFFACVPSAGAEELVFFAGVAFALGVGVGVADPFVPAPVVELWPVTPAGFLASAPELTAGD